METCELCKKNSSYLIKGLYEHHKTRLIPYKNRKGNYITTEKVFSQVKLCSQCDNFCRRGDNEENWLFKPCIQNPMD
jgi:hypothetical protein